MADLLSWLGGSSQGQTSRSGVNVAPETALEQQINPMLGKQMTGLEGLVGAGPGQQQVTGALGASQDYADMLGKLGQGGGLLAAQQAGIGGYTDIGNQLYGGLMRQQQVEASRAGARMGRGTNDLMLQNKLGQQRMDLVGSFAAQQAMAAPGQQAQFMGQRADVMQGLASQAMANRQALMSMGSNLREQDRSYRINTGERYSNTTQTQTKSPLDTITGVAGGLFGIAGAAANLGGKANASGGWGKMFGIGAGDGAPNPQAASDAAFANEFDQRQAGGLFGSANFAPALAGAAQGATRGMQQGGGTELNAKAGVDLSGGMFDDPLRQFNAMTPAANTSMGLNNPLMQQGNIQSAFGAPYTRGQYDMPYYTPRNTYKK